MTSQAVLDAQPKSVPEALAKIEPAAREARAEAPPNKLRIEVSAKKARAEAPPNQRTQPGYYQQTPLYDRFSIRCPFRKSYPDVLVMQSCQDWNGGDDTGPLDCSMQGRIFL
jgi:hypothetical protein